MTARPALDAWLDSVDEMYRAEQAALAARVFDFAAPVPPRSSGTAGEGRTASPANLSPAESDSREASAGTELRPSTSAGEPFAPGESTNNGRWEASTTDTGLDAPQQDQRTLPTPPAWLDKQLRRIRLRIAWRTAGR